MDTKKSENIIVTKTSPVTLWGVGGGGSSPETFLAKEAVNAI